MRWMAICALLSLVGCSGGGRFGYAREYTTLPEEDDYYERAAEPSYEEVRRDPHEFRDQLMSWFGIVENVDREGSTLRVALTQRFHQERHLCKDETSSSCRVTVSSREGGAFTALLTPRPEDLSGKHRLGVGSLVRVYGTTTGEFDDHGGPILLAKYYRHWPRATFVTTDARTIMRR